MSERTLSINRSGPIDNSARDAKIYALTLPPHNLPLQIISKRFVLAVATIRNIIEQQRSKTPN